MPQDKKQAESNALLPGSHVSAHNPSLPPYIAAGGDRGAHDLPLKPPNATVFFWLFTFTCAVRKKNHSLLLSPSPPPPNRDPMALLIPRSSHVSEASILLSHVSISSSLGMCSDCDYRVVS